jgi:hypothetical protein
MRKSLPKGSLICSPRHVQFGQSVVAEGRCLLREALLGVGDHDALPDAAQHVIHY